MKRGLLVQDTDYQTTGGAPTGSGRPATSASAEAEAEITRSAIVTAIHTAVQGRARFRVAGLRRSQDTKLAIEHRLIFTPGVHSVFANPLTGSVLVLYEPARPLEQIRTAIEQAVNTEDSDTRRRSHENSTLAQAGDTPPHAASILQPNWNTVPYAAGQTSESCLGCEAEELIARLDVNSAKGLAADQVEERRRKYGRNIEAQSDSRSPLAIVLDQVASAPVALLGASALLSLATGALLEAVAVASVVAINAAIGYTTESRVERIVSSLRTIGQPPATVMRDGHLREIHAQDVVPGDFLVLGPGRSIAADARLLQAQRLTVDESALTGESNPVAKVAGRLDRTDLPLGDRVNMVYKGTVVTGGNGLAVVVGTGRHTEIGAIQVMAGEAKPPPTPMQTQLDQLGRQLALISALVCGAVFVIGVARGYGLLQMLKSATSLAVAAVPEGLPAVATTTLALGIRAMRRKHVLIRHLHAVETMGAVQVMCLDKTGTLTMNRMSVVAIHVGRVSYTFSNGRIFKGQMMIDPPAREELLELLRTCVLCNDATMDIENSAPVLNGSSTEGALLKAAHDAGVDLEGARKQWPREKTSYRSEDQHIMSTQHVDSDGRRLLAVKGTPEEVLSRCKWRIVDGQRRRLLEPGRRAIRKVNAQMAKESLRVLGVARGEGDDDSLTWFGLVGMTDPLREGIEELIGEFRRAGIKPMIITGDQPSTAHAVGRALQLNAGGELRVSDAKQLLRLSPDALPELADGTDVFARVSPGHKLQIVQALQSRGKVVAMTGDGVNDGPALRAADIGVGMGRSGTDVARSMADVVLEEDDLRAMLAAVGQGRTTYGNIRKSLRFLLATNLSEIMVVLSAVSLGLGQPLSPMQLLWINLITDIFPGLALAMEPPEPDVLRRQPRDPREPIIGGTDLQGIGLDAAAISGASLAALCYGVARYGPGARASTIGFTALVAAQLLYALSCRSSRRIVLSAQKLPPNRYLTASLALSLVAQVCAPFVPGLRRVLGTTPIGLFDALVAAGAGLVPLLAAEAVKRPPEEIVAGDKTSKDEGMLPASTAA